MTGGSSAIARELKTINPETEEVINTYKMMTKEQINEKVKKAQNAFCHQKKDIQKRAEYLYHVARYYLLVHTRIELFLRSNNNKNKHMHTHPKGAS